jgi:hypothetical protein
MTFARAIMAAVLAASVGLTGGQPALAADQRTCRAEVAIFPLGNQQNVDLRVVIAARETVARVRVAGSGEWNASRTRTPSGADTIVFDTGSAIETLTVGDAGELLWEISYKNEPNTSQKVIAFIGRCDPWRPQ